LTFFVEIMSSQKEFTMKPLQFSQKLVVNIPIQDLWLFVARTNEFNQMSGVPQIKFKPVKQANGQIALNVTTMTTVPIRYLEMPFEWVKNQFHSVQRFFKGTPFEWAKFSSAIKAISPSQSEIEFKINLKPRNLLGSMLARPILKVLVGIGIKGYRKLAANYEKRAPQIFTFAKKPSVNETQLERLWAKLVESAKVENPELLQKFRQHLLTAPDSDVSKMRPFKWAEAWQEPRPDVLHLFLQATRIGIVDMEWDVLCPNCRVSKASFTSLKQLQKQAHCEVCDIEYDANFDQYVEVRFTVNPRVRTVSDATYCIAGPALSAHVVAQTRLAAGDKHSLSLVLSAGSYRLRSRPKGYQMMLNVTPDGPSQTQYSLESLENQSADPDETDILTLGTGPTTLVLENKTAQEILVLLEETRWDNYGASAAYVTSLQEFRDLFSSEVLAPGMGLEIRNLSLLFSDLKNSTALYEHVGDSQAYALVRDHFTILIEAIAKHEGSLVKTIGDAVMAVFSLPTSAVAASLQIQQEIMAWNRMHPDREPLNVKLGLHNGPVIAVNANDLLDYFGTTVNVAARAQGTSVGDDIVLTATIYNEPGVSELLGGQLVTSFQAELKGLSKTYTLYRVEPRFELEATLAPSQAATAFNSDVLA
jgi:class 3 adenylate cyclase